MILNLVIVELINVPRKPRHLRWSKTVDERCIRNEC